MRMLALMLSLVLAYPAAADDKPLATAETDAIATLDSTPVLFIVPIAKGEPSPVDGRVLDTASYIAIAQRTAVAEAERDMLKLQPQKMELGAASVVLAVIAMAGGVAVGWSLRAQFVK